MIYSAGRLLNDSSPALKRRIASKPLFKALAELGWVGALSKAGLKGYVKTNIFLTTYDESFVKELLKELEKKHRILEFSKSEVVDHFYYISVEGDARGFEEILKDKTPWYKVEVLEFS